MRRLLIPLATLLSALVGSRVYATEGRHFTCVSGADRWDMIQPAEDAAADKWPTWADCEAWRNGDPGPEYVWSYGPVTTTTTSTTSTEPPTSTTTVPELSTTLPEPSTTEAPTTTTEPPTTTTAATTTTTTQPPTTTTEPPTTTSSNTTTTTSTAIPQTTTTTEPPDPRIQQATRVIGATLAPGVTPAQAQTVLVISAATLALNPTRRNKK